MELNIEIAQLIVLVMIYFSLNRKVLSRSWLKKTDDLKRPVRKLISHFNILS